MCGLSHQPQAGGVQQIITRGAGRGETSPGKKVPKGTGKWKERVAQLPVLQLLLPLAPGPSGEALWPIG